MNEQSKHSKHECICGKKKTLDCASLKDKEEWKKNKGQKNSLTVIICKVYGPIKYGLSKGYSIVAKTRVQDTIKSTKWEKEIERKNKLWLQTNSGGSES